MPTFRSTLSLDARARLSTAALLLVVEYFLIGTSFDAAGLRERAGVSALAWLAGMAPALLAAGATLWLFAHESIDSLQGRSTDLARALATQLGSFTGLLLLSWAITSQHPATRVVPQLWMLAWVVAALATLLAALRIVWPLGDVARQVRREPRPVLLAGGVGVVAWLAGRASAQLWAPLGRATLELSAWLLGITSGRDLYLDEQEALLGVGEFVVWIGPDCSGYEGIGLLVVFTSAYLWKERARLRMPLSLVLLPCVVAASFVANALRIAALILIGAHVSPAIALEGFHAKAGWVLFCVLAVSSVVIVERTRWFSVDAARPAPRMHNPAASHLMPLVALLATALVTGSFAAGFDRFYGLRCATVLLALVLFRDARPRLSPDAPMTSVCVGAFVYAMWIALVPGDSADGDALEASLAALSPHERTAWILLRVVGATVFVPLAEELAFRGFLMRRFIAPAFEHVPLSRLHVPALLVSSLAFGAVHEAYVAGTLAGVAYALLVVRSGGLGNAVLAHGVTNALIALDVLLRGRFGLWA